MSESTDKPADITNNKLSSLGIVDSIRPHSCPKCPNSCPCKACASSANERGLSFIRELKQREIKKRDAHTAEQAIVAWLRQEKMIGPAFRVGDGWTETMPSNQITLSSVWAKVGTASKGKFKPVAAKEFIQ